MATRANVKPFSPTEARRIQDGLQQPAVFLNMASDWPVCNWSVDQLAVSLGDKHIRFRLGRKDETNCEAKKQQTFRYQNNNTKCTRINQYTSLLVRGHFSDFNNIWKTFLIGYNGGRLNVQSWYCNYCA